MTPSITGLQKSVKADLNIRNTLKLCKMFDAFWLVSALLLAKSKGGTPKALQVGVV
jgi:hypothetical protein